MNNNDIISRTAAIEAMRECWRRVKQFAKPFEANRIMDCINAVKDLPAVDAVPVKWLRSQLKNNPNDIESAYDDICINDLIDRWQKEQEARA